MVGIVIFAASLVVAAVILCWLESLLLWALFGWK